MGRNRGSLQVPATICAAGPGRHVASKLRKDAANLARAMADTLDALDSEVRQRPRRWSGSNAWSSMKVVRPPWATSSRQYRRCAGLALDPALG